MEQNDTPTPNTPTSSKPKRRFLAGLLTGSILGGLMATTAGFVAHAQEGPRWLGGRCMHAAWGGHHRMSPEAMRERLEFGTDWALSRVKATDAQKAATREIVLSAFNDVVTLREAHHANRNAIMETLTADTVDRDKLEALRRAELQLAEQASGRITRALADVSDVLTPEQRRALADLMRKHRGPMALDDDRPAPTKRS